MERKRRRPNLTGISAWAVGGWRRKSSSKSTIKFAPPKSILRCVPMFHSTASCLTRNTGPACTGENSCATYDKRISEHQIQDRGPSRADHVCAATAQRLEHRHDARDWRRVEGVRSEE